MSDIERITMTSKEAAKYLGIGYNKILDLTAQNKIPHIRLGKTYYYTKEFLDKWLVAEQTKPSKEEGVEDQMKKKYPHLCG
jgi:excisionase family DNA binding protein